MGFESKLAALKKGGLEKLHCIFDFDRTLTTYVRGGSSFSPVRRLGFMPEEYAEKALQLYAHYHPMELDPTLPTDEKLALMHEWWEAQLLLMIQYGLKREHLEGVAEAGMVTLRPGVRELFQELHQHGIPVLVLSAGFGDVIEMVLRHEGLLSSNVHVIANFLDYDETGKSVAYRPPIIHGLNKCEQDLGPYAAAVKGRPNVLLVGDMLGDANMADGLPHETVLKVALLSQETEPDRAAYEARFDLVLEGENPFRGVTELWRQILSGGTL